MVEAICFPETSVLTTATQRHIPDDGVPLPVGSLEIRGILHLYRSIATLHMRTCVYQPAQVAQLACTNKTEPAWTPGAVTVQDVVASHTQALFCGHVRFATVGYTAKSFRTGTRRDNLLL